LPAALFSFERVAAVLFSAALLSFERVAAALFAVALFSAAALFAGTAPLAVNSPGFDVAAIGGLP
jgi:hypothetical protein